MPKYGFPVDVVELQLMHHGREANRLELHRDLRIAISEYAPESEVIAGGRVWVSYGLKKLPERKWLEYHYTICPACGHYQKSLKDAKIQLHTCRVCKSPLRQGRTKGVFVIPEFGFVTNTNEPKRPGERRPQRTFSSRAYFSDDERGQAECCCTVVLNNVTMTAVPYSEGRLTVLNRTGFNICTTCGFAIRADSKTPSSHSTPWGTECLGKLSRRPKALGHEFKTDVVDIRFDSMPKTDESFRFSLLYAMLEGMSESLEISRNDIDGCLFTDTRGLAFILYDTVPGGAGHVKRVAQESDTLREMLQAALRKVSGQCGCGEETSCYGCLRNYRNQFCHEQLRRGHVKDFLHQALL